MALANYPDLKASIAGWLARSDLTSRIPDFVTLCEARFHRVLRLRVQEQRATANTSSEYTALPNLFLEARNFQINGTPVTRLLPMAPQVIDSTYAGRAGKPKFFAIVGNEIQLAPAPDGTYTLEMDYYEKFDALSDSNQTNWLMTNAPDVYLFGSLSEAAPFIRSDARTAIWEQKYRDGIAALQQESDEAVYSGGAMQMRWTP
jgi:hypothetical protein